MLKLNNNYLLTASVFALVLNSCSAKKDNAQIQNTPKDSSVLVSKGETNLPSSDTTQIEFIISLDGYKATPLGQAVYNGDSLKVRALIDQGASFEKGLTDETYEFDILYTALSFNKAEMVRYILNNKLYSSVNKTYTEESENPLTLACNLQDTIEALELSKILITLGANVNGSGESGGEQTKYPIIIAVNHNNYGLTKILLDKGANQEVKDNSGKTALSIAQENGFNTIATLLKGI